jgi:CheY-like chemotaxis protein
LCRLKGISRIVTEQVLFVDDEPHLLDAIQRSLRKRLSLHTASSGAEALGLLRAKGPFALVIADMRMPEMNGVQFLSRVREESPESVRMILSGQADLEATVAAINSGRIFRFLNKPCSPDQLMVAIEDGFEQFRLQRVEKLLLEETVAGAVKMLIDILGLVSPAATSRAARLQRYVNAMVAGLHLADNWQWPLAALMSQIGCVTLPKDLMSKAEAGQVLAVHEKLLYEAHPDVAGRLLSTIPRFEDVAYIVAAQDRAATIGKSANWRDCDVRTVGHALLHAAHEFDQLVSGGVSPKAAVERLRAVDHGIPEAMANALLTIPLSTQPWAARQVMIKDLAPGMVFDEDLVSSKGLRIVPEGHEVTRSLIAKLTSFNNGVGVVEPFRVRIQS